MRPGVKIRVLMGCGYVLFVPSVKARAFIINQNSSVIIHRIHCYMVTVCTFKPVAYVCVFAEPYLPFLIPHLCALLIALTFIQDVVMLEELCSI